MQDIRDFLEWRERRATTPPDLSVEAYEEEIAGKVARATLQAARELLAADATIEDIKTVLRGDQT